MNPVKWMARKILAGDAARHQNRAQRRRYSAMAANVGALGKGGDGKGSFPGIRSKYDEDAANKDYLYALYDLQSRAQDLDVNNPDLHGFHRARVAQILGKGVAFKCAFRHSEIGLTAPQTTKLAQAIDRLRKIHSRLGGFDATGNNRSEGKQQERAMLTAIVVGSCLIHRVWRDTPPGVVAFSIELIPGSRISTPNWLKGSTTTSYGVEYADAYRTRITGWWVKRVSKTIGDSFNPEPNWDFVPVEDGSLLSLTEIAGIDRAIPLATSTIRMLRNRGEFIESAVECARAQAKHYAKLKTAPGADAYQVAADDADYSDPSGCLPVGISSVSDSVDMFYTQNGEELDFMASKLPDPDFTGFMAATDSRLSRGLVSSLSRFTREVNSSWAGGRLEDQQDDPIIDQYRDGLLTAWYRVHEWFIEAVWLEDALESQGLELPGYSAATQAAWTEYRATFPGKLHINPQDTMGAREKAYMLRSQSPLDGAEEDGTDARETLEKWAHYQQMQTEVEAAFSLEPGSLDVLFSGKALTTSAGADVQPPPGQAEPDPGTPPDSSVPQNTRKQKGAMRYRALTGRAS